MSAYPPTGYPQTAYPPAAQVPAQQPVAYPPTGYPQTQQAPGGYPPPAYPTAAYAPAANAPVAYAPAQAAAAAPVAGYPAMGYQAAGYPATGYPAAVQMPGQATSEGTLQCRLCGCVPAAQVTFREHHGLILFMQFVHLKGPFCRDCGLATFRRMTAMTLIRGWYGYASVLITPITVLINLARRGKVANLPQPTRPPTGVSRQPLDPGPVLLARPTALIGLALPAFVIVLIIALIALGG
ncbi:hypothetical protein GCM10023322_73650 [Rugosimonospora acidiphila]|uniref:Toxin-antitoxin system, toxin component n=2 Tax=Rugosimonospora acidiphila TaxID=556531 RepID=A0ABP9SNK0_9ACTN